MQNSEYRLSSVGRVVWLLLRCLTEIIVVPFHLFLFVYKMFVVVESVEVKMITVSPVTLILHVTQYTANTNTVK